MTVEHKLIGASGIHSPYRWTWANETARLAETVVEGDVYKIGFQTSDKTTWVLINHSAVAPADRWGRVDAFADKHPSVTGEEVHTPFRWTFADLAARDAIVTGDLKASDVGRIALQQAPIRSMWMLTNIDPVTWEKVDGEPWRWVVANETALNALTPVGDDLYRLALVLDTNTVYVRLASSWVKINNDKVEGTFNLRFKGVLDPANNLVTVKAEKDTRTGSVTLFFPAKSFDPSEVSSEWLQLETAGSDFEPNGTIPEVWRSESMFHGVVVGLIRFSVDGIDTSIPASVAISTSGNVWFNRLKENGVGDLTYSSWPELYKRGFRTFSVTYKGVV